MTNQANSAPAFVAAKVSQETASQSTKAIVQAFASNATAVRKADRDLLGTTVKAVRLIGVPITEAQWLKQFAPGIRKGLEAKGLTDVAGALSRAKVVALATLSRPSDLPADTLFWGDVLAGETMNAFCSRIREALPHAKLPDGTWIVERATDEAGKPTDAPKAKAGAQPGAAKPKAKGSDQERLNAARIVLGTSEAVASEDVAKRFLQLVAEHRSELDKFMTDTLARAAEADAAKAAKTSLTPKPAKAA